MGKRSHQVEIRSYRAEDHAACRALWVELTEWHRHIYESPQIGGADPGSKLDEHLEQIGHERLWLATMGGEVVGMAGVIAGEREHELEPIVVGERWRGRGIGRRLAQHVVGEALNASTRYVVTRPVARNASAIRFFHGLGFDAIGQLELLLDLRPRAAQVWRPGATIGGSELRV
jgi:N-acetylglutamate synthase-like GNAT family acetyltransferase